MAAAVRERHDTFFLGAGGREVLIFYFHRRPIALHPAEKRTSGAGAQSRRTGGDVRLDREAGCKTAAQRQQHAGKRRRLELLLEEPTAAQITPPHTHTHTKNRKRNKTWPASFYEIIKSFHHISPSNQIKPSRTLPSFDSGLLVTPRISKCRCGVRAFSCQAPLLWNH